VAFIGKRRGAYRVLLGRSERKASLERRKHSREDNIKMDFQELAWGVVD